MAGMKSNYGAVGSQLTKSEVGKKKKKEKKYPRDFIPSEYQMGHPEQPWQLAERELDQKLEKAAKEAMEAERAKKAKPKKRKSPAVRITDKIAEKLGLEMKGSKGGTRKRKKKAKK